MKEQQRPNIDVRQMAASLHDGTLEEKEFVQMMNSLAESEAAREEYIDYVALHVMLESRHEPALQPATAIELSSTFDDQDIHLDRHLGVDGSAKEAPQNARSGQRKVSLWALAASIVLGWVAALFWRADNQPEFVAVLTETSGIQWFSNPPGDAPTRLTKGSRLHFTEGLAELTFTSGAVVVVKGPAELELVSPMCVRANRGAVRARVGSEAKGFIIETPTANVVDMGTEFGVDVNDHGATDVVVFDGEVLLTYDPTEDLGNSKRKHSPSRPIAENQIRLSEGYGMHIGLKGRISRIVSINSDRFPIRATSLPINSRPVITSVHDNIPVPEGSQFYQIAHGAFREDAQVYVDRQHQYNGVDGNGLPEFLIGCDYVMTFNSDKWQEGLKISLSLAEPAELFVIYDSRLPVPEWLTLEFVNTDAEVGIDEFIHNRAYPNQALAVGPGKSIDTTHSVWRRVVEQPGVVQLGAIGKHELRVSMYGIAARRYHGQGDKSDKFDPRTARQHQLLERLTRRPDLSYGLAFNLYRPTSDVLAMYRN